MTLDPCSNPTVTLLLGRLNDGDESARQELFDIVYAELRGMAQQLMQRERAAHTLQPTALVNEAALRLLDDGSLANMKCRAYFFAAMARAMRQVLVAHAKRRKRIKRGGKLERVPLDEAVEFVERQHKLDLIALDEAIDDLQRHSPRHSDVVTLRFFGGLAINDIAQQLGVSESTVVKDLQFARVWLGRKLRETSD